MKEYIEREALLKECDDTISNIQFSSPYQDDIDTMVSGMERIRDMICEAPAVDVAPVVNGEWIEDQVVTLRCSVCGYKPDSKSNKVIEVGDTPIYKSGKYYYDSYGTSPAGTRGQGKKVKVT